LLAQPAAATALNDLWNLAAFTTFAALTRAQNRKKTRRPLANRLGELFYEEPDSNERLRVSDWIVQGL
jgi:hypothetical protein